MSTTGEAPQFRDRLSSDELEALAVILKASISGDHRAADWLAGRCSIAVYEGRIEVDYGYGSRTSPVANDWRLAVFTRDGFQCQRCGRRGNLNAHHVRSWATYPEERFDLDNGIALCVDCHVRQHPKHANLIRKARYHHGPSD